MPRRYPTPERAEAVRAASDLAARFGGTEVRVFAEALDTYGPGRNPFTFPGVIRGLDVLPGSSVLTGRVIVDVSVQVRYQKTATRGGSREYRTAPARPRLIVVWPWDLAAPAASSRDADRTE